MRRTIQNGSILTLLLAGMQVGCADFSAFKHNSSIDRARNNTWPQPFRAGDANSVVASFEIMKDNGWRDNNTIGDMLFNEHGLNESGKLKVSQITFDAPQNRRIIFVQSGRSKQETDARVESVQLAVSEMLPTGALPEILVTDIPPTTSSGAYQTIVSRAIVSTTPTPRLSKFTGVNAPAQTSVAPQGK